MVFKGAQEQTKQSDNNGGVKNLCRVGELTVNSEMAYDIGKNEAKYAGNDARIFSAQDGNKGKRHRGFGP